MSPLQRRILGAAITIVPLVLLFVFVLVPLLAPVSVCLGMVAGVCWLVRWALHMDSREREVRALERSFGEGWKT